MEKIIATSNVDVFILTASFGSGHNSTMNALIDKFKVAFEGLNVQTGDIFDITTPYMKDYFTETYDALTKNNVSVYNKLYNIRDMKKNVIDDIMIKLFINKFDDYMSEINPKIIISVFPTSAQFSSYYKSNFNPKVHTITVITDVVSSWEWIAPFTDYYFVPTLEVKENLIKKQVDMDKILVTGIPVRREFETDLQNFYIKNKVLLMGSAMGNIEIDKSIIDQMSTLPYEFIIIAGKNQELYEKLISYKLPHNVELVGFTKDIAKYMKSCDLLVTKPGGATVFEAISVGIPMLIPPTMVGQENHNTNFIVDYQFGMTFSNMNDMVGKVALCMNNPQLLMNIRKNMYEFNANTQIDEAIQKIGDLCKLE